MPVFSIQGKVSDVAREGNSASFNMTDQYQKSDHIMISPLTKIYEGSVGAEFSYQDDLILPRDGEYVEIIGRKRDDGTVLAVNVMLP